MEVHIFEQNYEVITPLLANQNQVIVHVYDLKTYKLGGRKKAIACSSKPSPYGNLSTSEYLNAHLLSYRDNRHFGWTS